MNEKTEMHALPPRPGTAGSLRPGTAGRRRSPLDNVGDLAAALPMPNNAMPSIAAIRQSQNHILDPSTAIRQTASNDSLLRIMAESDAQRDNEVLILAETGNLAGIQQMIDSGYNIAKVRGMDGFTPLHHACNRGHAAIVSELLRAHLPMLQVQTSSGDTPLHLSVYSGNLLLVEQLIDRGADLNATNNYGETPLFYAARKSMPAFVRLLLQRGANAQNKDRFGDIAEDHADDLHTKKAFNCHSLVEYDQRGPRIAHEELLHIFRYLTVKDVCRAACVSGKWHRVSESEELWRKLGVRRWEASLHASLGLLQTSSSFLSRPAARRPSKDKVVPPSGPNPYIIKK